ncbi:MAG: NADH-quinone oxidoreductase subunit C, partial [Candidatus Omnitrophica bacterium]|nr:NADH-quinone oxidoreductase subunit C [Candidatus Omnitrophota bacterium]
ENKIGETVSQDEILQNLLKKFPFLEGKIRAPRARRIFSDDITANFDEVFNYAVKDLEFSILLTITGLDEGQRLTFIYHVARVDGNILSIKISAPKSDPIIKTIIPKFFGADIYERELVDLLVRGG